jgi:hypothetical protein
MSTLNPVYPFVHRGVRQTLLDARTPRIGIGIDIGAGGIGTDIFCRMNLQTPRKDTFRKYADAVTMTLIMQGRRAI